MNLDLENKLKNLDEMAQDAKDVRKMNRQTTNERVDGKIEYSRDKTSIKFVQGEEVQKQVRFKQDNVVFEPFNLREEQEEGFFDESGNYVRRNRKGDEYDAWADTLEQDELKAIQEREKLIQEKEQEVIDEPKLIFVIHEILLPNETVAKALKRLSPKPIQVEKTKTKQIEKIKKQKITVPCEEFNKLTDAAYKLMEIGYTNIYEEERENLKIKEPEIMWEYTMDPRGDELFGPFSQDQIKYWISEGYFTQMVPFMRRCDTRGEFISLKQLDCFK